MPIFSGLSLIILLSSMGLPGLNGFVGEFTILLGTFGSPILGGVFAVFATLGVILAAVYLLHMWNKVFMGESNGRKTAPAAAALERVDRADRRHRAGAADRAVPQAIL